MKRSFLVTQFLAVVVGMSLVFVGCSQKDDGNLTPGSYAQSLDSAARDANGLAPDASAYASILPASDYQIGQPDLPTINDLYTSGDLVYAVHANGVLVYNLKSSDYTLIPVADDLRSMAVHNDTIYVGGDHLYELSGIELKLVDSIVPGHVNKLLSFGPSLLIGTDLGLYSRSLDMTLPLLDGMNISDLVADETVLWVGTVGDGLYRYDGDLFQKRFLTRAPELFDNVNALDFSHGHLYLGTDNGMFVYDGGRWETVSVEQGMPSDEIVSIDADGWIVYVGTAGGAVTWYQDLVKPVKHLDETIVTSFCRAGNRVISGTLYDGLAVKNGPAITLVAAPWQAVSDKLASTPQ